MSRLASLITAVVIAARFCAVAAPDPKKSIQQLELDDRAVHTIPVSSNRVTTISFPGPISALDGANLTTDGKTPAFFQLAYKPGAEFFSVRSLVRDGVTNLNVRWNNRTYVLELRDSKTPWLSVLFQNGDRDKALLATKPVTPAVLVGLLDKAKAYPLLKQHHPELVEQVDYASFTSEPRVIDYQDYEVRLEEVFRFDPQDTLVFRVTLRNKSDKEILYKAQGFAVRVGDRVYNQSISDAAGLMPPKADAPAYFAITGTPMGGRNDISIKNDFTVLVTRLDAQMTEAVASVPVGQQTTALQK